MNQLYCPSTFTSNPQIAVHTQQLLFSKNSCFTPYQQNVWSRRSNLFDIYLLGFLFMFIYHLILLKEKK